jgi:Mechanosensitive ion channel, conserved TM helix
MAIVGAINWSDGIQNAWNDIAAWVPKFIGFLVILLIGYFIAKVISRVLDRVLERVGFDRWVERGGVKVALERSRYDASSLLAKIVFYAVMLFVLQLAFGVFGPNPISDIIHSVIGFLPRLFVAILIIVVASAIAAGVKDLLSAAMGGLSYGRMLATLASVAIVAIGIFAALSELQIATPIVNGLFYALLAIIAGSAIVAIGGSGIGPMRRVWERALSRVEEEGPRVRAQAAAVTQSDDRVVSIPDAVDSPGRPAE